MGNRVKEITEQEIEKKILSISLSKATQNSDIPTKILKNNVDIYSLYLYNILNACIRYSVFPDAMKTANVTPVFKKKDRISKENYTPVRILPIASKIFERCLYNQVEAIFCDKYSKFQCAFRKGLALNTVLWQC